MESLEFKNVLAGKEKQYHALEEILKPYSVELNQLENIQEQIDILSKKGDLNSPFQPESDFQSSKQAFEHEVAQLKNLTDQLKGIHHKQGSVFEIHMKMKSLEKEIENMRQKNEKNKD